MSDARCMIIGKENDPRIISHIKQLEKRGYTPMIVSNTQEAVSTHYGDHVARLSAGKDELEWKTVSWLKQQKENLIVANTYQQNPKSLSIERKQPKAGRNDTCPCGSGLKYKKCCISKPQPFTP